MFVVNYRRSMPYGFFPCVARSNEISVDPMVSAKNNARLYNIVLS